MISSDRCIPAELSYRARSHPGFATFSTPLRPMHSFAVKILAATVIEIGILGIKTIAKAVILARNTEVGLVLLVVLVLLSFCFQPFCTFSFSLGPVFSLPIRCAARNITFWILILNCWVAALSGFYFSGFYSGRSNYWLCDRIVFQRCSIVWWWIVIEASIWPEGW